MAQNCTECFSSVPRQFGKGFGQIPAGQSRGQGLCRSRPSSRRGDPKKVFEASYAQIHEALRTLVKHAIKRRPLKPCLMLFVRAVVVMHYRRPRLNRAPEDEEERLMRLQSTLDSAAGNNRPHLNLARSRPHFVSFFRIRRLLFPRFS